MCHLSGMAWLSFFSCAYGCVTSCWKVVLAALPALSLFILLVFRWWSRSIIPLMDQCFTPCSFGKHPQAMNMVSIVMGCSVHLPLSQLLLFVACKLSLRQLCLWTCFRFCKCSFFCVCDLLSYTHVWFTTAEESLLIVLANGITVVFNHIFLGRLHDGKSLVGLQCEGFFFHLYIFFNLIADETYSCVWVWWHEKDWLCATCFYLSEQLWWTGAWILCKR